MAGKLLIIEPKPVIGIQSAHGSDTNHQNVLTNDPKEVWTSPDIGTRALTLDFGVPVTVDSFYIGFTNADADATVRPQSAVDAAGTGGINLTAPLQLRAADCKTTRSSAMVRLPAPVTHRYLRFPFENNTPAWQVGIIRVGLAFEAEWDREWGSGRRPIDTGRSTALLSGGFGTQEGARKAGYSWTFGDLTEAELETLWGIFLRTGTTNPVVVNEVDGATVGANEKLHYGLFQRLDPFERRDPNATKWGMEMEEWI